MHLIEAWSGFPPLELARLLGMPIAIFLAALLPGSRVAAAAAIAVAVGAAALDELAAPSLVRAGWVALWLLVAWQSGARGPEGGAVAPARRGAFAAGAVALPLGLGLILLLLASLSRQGLAVAEARRASLGALVLGAGLLHLMLRRYVRRSLVAFAGLGLGLELLAASARAADVLHAGPPAGAALAAAGLAVALAARVAGGRERFAGSPMVNDARELHD